MRVSLIPGAAANWTVSEDRLTYTFTLRPANWSDGTPVTALDFRRAFRRLIDPATDAPDAALFNAFRGAQAIQAGKAAPYTLGVRAIDARTLVISLSEEEPLLLHLLARPAAMPVPRSAVTIDRIPEVTAPFNGAYRFDGFDPSQGIWLVKNQLFREADTVAIETVIYRNYDRQRALVEFAAGALLVSNEVPIFSLAQIEEEHGDALRIAPHAGTFFLAANLDGVLADPGLRRAIALAIDRIALAEEIWMAAMVPTLSIVPNGVADLGEPATAELGPNDPPTRQIEARSLLAAAGFGPDHPLPLTLAIGAGAVNRASAEAIISDLAEINVMAILKERPVSEHNQRLTGNRDFDIATVAWIGELGHVNEFLTLFEESDLNVTGYDSPAFTSLIVEARMTLDQTVRTALYAAADRQLMRDLPAIPLLHYASLNLVSDRIVGWEDNAVDIHLSRWLSLAPR